MYVKTRGLFGFLIVFVLVTAGAAATSSDLRLIDAVKQGNEPAVSTLLKERVDVNGPEGDGTTALLWAAHKNELGIADQLIHAGANVNATNDFGVTSLSLACTNGNAKLVEMLTTAGANPNAAISTGETPIMTCARAGSVDAVRTLVARGAVVNAKEPVLGQTALMWAASEHHPDVMQMLIEHGADIKARTKQGFTALHFAAREGELEGARLLLASGLDVNVRSQKAAAGVGNVPGYTTSDGATPLLVATMRAQVPFALFLLDKGAEPNIAGAIAPLHWAVTTWEGEQANPLFGFTDAMSGIPDRKAKVQLVKALLAHGADPNLKAPRRPPDVTGGSPDVPGATPFFLAAYACDLEIMQLLLDAGADPKIPARNNTTPLMAVVGINRRISESDVTEDQAIEATKLVLERGVNIKALNSLGETALHAVSYMGWNKLVQLLVDKGAEVNIVTKSGLTPYLIAEGFGDRTDGVNYNKETAALLLKLGADPNLGTRCMAQAKCRELKAPAAPAVR